MTSQKTVWTTHWDLAEADTGRFRSQYPFDASKLPTPAPEYLIEVEALETAVRGKKLKSVDVISPEGLGLPRHKIHLVHCWGNGYGACSGTRRKKPCAISELLAFSPAAAPWRG